MKGIAKVASLVAVLALAGTAAAGNHGGAPTNGGGSSKSSGSSISLVMLAAGTAGTSGPRWGDQVTFNVSTTQTAYPSVQADCTQNGTLVYRQVGFFYNRPDTPVFTLSSTAWTGGAADCVANLYYVNAKGQSVTLASTSFSVSA